MRAATLRPKARILRVVATFALSTAIGRTALAQVVAAEPVAPITAPYPDAGDGREVQIVLQLIVDASGHVESVVETSRAPSNAAEAFSSAAMDAAKHANFKPSSRDGK